MTTPQHLPATSRWLAVVAALLALAGVAVSGYLAIENLRGETGICVGVGGCSTVQDSKYGEILGVPVSMPGFIPYVALAALAILYLRNVADRAADFVLLGFLGALAGFLMSAYLTYIEAFVLDAWCSYCIVSALLMVGLFAIWSWLLFAASRGAGRV